MEPADERNLCSLGGSFRPAGFFRTFQMANLLNVCSLGKPTQASKLTSLKLKSCVEERYFASQLKVKCDQALEGASRQFWCRVESATD